MGQRLSRQRVHVYMCLCTLLISREPEFKEEYGNIRGEKGGIKDIKVWGGISSFSNFPISLRGRG